MTMQALTSSPSAQQELYLISAVLQTGDLTSARQAGVQPEWFMAYRMEWEWLLSRTDQRKGTVPMVVDFQRQWPNVMLQDADDVVLYAEALRDSWATDVLRSSMLEAAGLLQARTPEVIRRTVEGLTATMRTVNRNIEPQNSFSFTGGAKDVSAEVKQRYLTAKANGGLAGTPFGLPTVDHLTGGKTGAMFAVIAARTNVGKSWILALAALNAALKGKRVLIFSLEMDAFAYSVRMMAMESWINRAQLPPGVDPFDPGALFQGTVSQETGKHFHSWTTKLKDRVSGEIEIVDKRRGSVTIGSILAAIDKFRPDEVYVDGIQILKPSRKLGSNASDWQSVAEVSGELFDIAGEHKMPVIATSQINRTFVSETNPPDVEGLARTDAIGQDADLVLTLTAYAPNVLRAKVAKTRLGGGRGTIFSIAFEPMRGRIEEVSMNVAEQMRNSIAMMQISNAGAIPGIQP